MLATLGYQRAKSESLVLLLINCTRSILELIEHYLKMCLVHNVSLVHLLIPPNYPSVWYLQCDYSFVQSITARIQCQCITLGIKLYLILQLQEAHIFCLYHVWLEHKLDFKYERWLGPWFKIAVLPKGLASQKRDHVLKSCLQWIHESLKTVHLGI